VPWPPHGDKKAPRPSDTSGVLENTTCMGVILMQYLLFADVKAWAAPRCVERAPSPTGKVEGGERMRTADDVSKADQTMPKPGCHFSGISLGDCSETAQAASGMEAAHLGQEGAICGRPAHDYWMNSPSSGQHTATIRL
jgi:hypothetical protein